MLLTYKGAYPRIDESAFVAETAVLAGDVVLEEDSSVWFGAVLRGDMAAIRVGKRSNVQDNVTVHCDTDCPTIIGDDVTIGHNAVVHGARIDDGCLIGMQATVLTGAHIGEGSIVAAGALVRENQEVPPRSLAVGVPAKIARVIDDAAAARIKENAGFYVEEAQEYRAGI